MTTSACNNLARQILIIITLITPFAKATAFEEQYATGQPETMLGGVRIGQTHVIDIISMYGPPIQEAGSFGEGGISTIAGDKNSFIWIKECAVLYVGTDDDGTVNSMNLSTKDKSCTAENIAKGPIAQTGRGLRLRDDKAAWNRIYGSQLGLASDSNDCCGGTWKERDESCDMTIGKGVRFSCFRKTRFAATFNDEGNILSFLLELTHDQVPPAVNK